MSDLSLPGDILSPEAIAKKRLARAPVWLQRLASNALAIVAWIGLPSTVVSAFSNMRWVLDAWNWVYAHAGVVQPVLGFLAVALNAVVAVWRWLTHPVWHAIAEWLHVSLPDWAPDMLTLVALIGFGVLRRVMRVAWGETVSGGHMFGGAKPDFGRPEDKIAIPRSFPYERHFAECGVRWNPRRLHDAKILWRKWRRYQIRTMLAYDGRVWPKFHKDVICAEFERYWLSITEGRRDMLLYAGATVLVLLALVADWWLRLT